MKKSPRLIRTEQYLKLSAILSSHEKATGEALETYLNHPTPENKKSLDDARDSMNKIASQSIQEYNELKAQDTQSFREYEHDG